MRAITYFILTSLLVAFSCKNADKGELDDFESVRSEFQREIDGQVVDLFQLRNESIEITITNYGGRLVDIIVPDKDGNRIDVNLGYHSLDEYLKSNEIYYGALIGRFANRIGGASFMLDSVTYMLNANNGPNQLHGGPGGFHNVIWDVIESEQNRLKLHYLSKDLEENYPGNLDIYVTYEIDGQGGLAISYEAKTDKKTVINLTSHPFFNLNGDGSGSINEHVLEIKADLITPVNSELIPTSEMLEVGNTPFDFRTPTAIGDRLEDNHEQLALGLGYDHNFVLNKGLTSSAQKVAEVYSAESGIKMEVHTTEPGLQFYGGNFLSGNDTGKNGVYSYRSAFCLESQHFPDSPNRLDYPDVTLEPGQTFRSKTIYRFGLVSE